MHAARRTLQYLVCGSGIENEARPELGDLNDYLTDRIDQCCSWCDRDVESREETSRHMQCTRARTCECIVAKDDSTTQCVNHSSLKVDCSLYVQFLTQPDPPETHACQTRSCSNELSRFLPTSPCTAPAASGSRGAPASPSSRDELASRANQPLRTRRDTLRRCSERQCSSLPTHQPRP
jgi:hypothetical protein